MTDSLALVWVALPLETSYLSAFAKILLETGVQLF